MEFNFMNLRQKPGANSTKKNAEKCPAALPPIENVAGVLKMAKILNGHHGIPEIISTRLGQVLVVVFLAALAIVFTHALLI
ncbi:hypothetical protein [Afipia felis]|nr:hypothetical protein [Afipia felis]